MIQPCTPCWSGSGLNRQTTDLPLVRLLFNRQFSAGSLEPEGVLKLGGQFSVRRSEAKAANVLVYPALI